MNDSNPFPVWSGQPKQGAAPASNHLDGTAVGMKEYCKTCKMPFKDYDALLEHKLSDPKHNMCYVCMAEFKTLAAKDNHQKQWHAHQQNLKCPKCHERFPTLGGLVYHIESEKCIINFYSRYQVRTQVQDQMQYARNWKGSRTEDKMNGMNEEPLPPVRNYAAQIAQPTSIVAEPPQTPPFARPETAGIPVEVQLQQPIEADEDKDEDLISFEKAEDIAKSRWGASTAARRAQMEVTLSQSQASSVLSEQPVEVANAVEIQNWPVVGNTTDHAACVGHKTVSQISAPAVKSVVVSDSNTTEQPPFDPHKPDPTHLNFKVTPYWIQYTKTYKCPWRGCKKTFSSAVKFITHLKSPAHRAEKFQCRTCFNYFDTVAALAQHSSAQGRCWARHTDQFDAEVDRMTAGFASIGGRWDDDTIKYTINQNILLTREAMENANRAQLNADAEKKGTFWDTHKPNW